MVTFLLDTSVIVDTLNGKRGRAEVLDELLIRQETCSRLLSDQHH